MDTGIGFLVFVFCLCSLGRNSALYVSVTPLQQGKAERPSAFARGSSAGLFLSRPLSFVTNMSNTNGNDLSVSNTDNNSHTEYLPSHTDGTPIKWDGNDATIPGTLAEIEKYYKRTGFFQTLIKSHAVPLPSGKLAVDSFSAAHFLQGTATDGEKYTLTDPCPLVGCCDRAPDKEAGLQSP